VLDQQLELVGVAAVLADPASVPKAILTPPGPAAQALAGDADAPVDLLRTSGL
jgi:hypothetical protein